MSHDLVTVLDRRGANTVLRWTKCTRCKLTIGPNVWGAGYLPKCEPARSNSR